MVNPTSKSFWSTTLTRPLPHSTDSCRKMDKRDLTSTTWSNPTVLTTPSSPDLLKKKSSKWWETPWLTMVLSELDNLLLPKVISMLFTILDQTGLSLKVRIALEWWSLLIDKRSNASVTLLIPLRLAPSVDKRLTSRIALMDLLNSLELLGLIRFVSLALGALTILNSLLLKLRRETTVLPA